MKAHRYCRADIISQTGADGLVGDPRSCKFDPSTIVCKQGDNSTCLTPKQAVALKQIYEGMKTPDGHPIYPGRMPGVEGGWSNFITGASPGSSRLSQLRHRISEVLRLWQSRVGLPHVPLWQAHYSGAGDVRNAINFRCGY